MVSAMNLHPLTPEQKNEYTRIAYYYYEAGQTQDQIAQRLGISRQRVNRILAECLSGASFASRSTGARRSISRANRRWRKNTV